MTLADHAHDLLLAHGHLAESDLFARLRDNGATTAKTSAGLRGSLLSHPSCLQRPDGRWDTTLRLLVGSTLTVRVRSRVREDVLWIHQDLEPYVPLVIRAGVPLASGGRVRRGDSQVLTWVGPPGWLPPIPDGGLLGLSWDGTQLSVRPVQNPPAADDPAVGSAIALLRQHASSPRGIDRWRVRERLSFAGTVTSALMEDPDLFALPLLPLSELLMLPMTAAPRGWDELPVEGQQVLVPLSLRVADELTRRAQALGKSVVEHASMLLTAAVDRVLPPTRSCDCYECQPPRWAEGPLSDASP